ncbi:GntR family transcriptional regulator [Goodfellowiella coeruleoviolacea]|uniref:Transcriptional regulator, GntR family n=1 Tax=Goodfellowiella coeruleoviolacea TaxID=334858 RepID=A0AAE3GGF7_9PSEU|nr:GntR family transcriptional regulator [Goodfellowiella coeruleoviolacea]MCP2167807.1 transcriptional regulator, GntR family [Goodfellowiella coeruleoviolacea]
MTLPAVSPGALPSRTAHVLETIKAAILNGRFKPGTALVENELAGQFGVSKTPVREALKALEGSGLVVIRPYTGTTVREVTEQDALAIYDMRLLLEPEAVRRSVNAGSDFAEAEHALERAALAEDASTRSTANRDFHRGLYAGCGNPLLVQTLDGLRDQTALVSASSWARTPSWAEEAREHAAILDQVRAGNAEAAATLVRHHIEGFVVRHLRREHPTH